MTTKVLLTDTSWWPLASRVALAFAKLGCSVSAVYPAHGHPLSKTRVVRERYHYRALDPVGSVRTAIEKAQPDLVVPCDDRAVRHLYQVHARAVEEQGSGKHTRALIEKSLGAPASYPVVSSRYQLLTTAGEVGIRVPETYAVTGLDDLKFKYSGMRFPWVLKAEGTWGGHGIKIAHNSAQAERYFLELSRPLSTARYVKRLMVDRDPYWFEPWRHQAQAAVIAQAFIGGRPANSVMACWRGEVLAEIAVEVVNAQGATGPATIVKVVDRPEMQFAAQRLAARLGLSGCFGLDFMIEEETKNIYLIEMNPRCTPLSHLALGPRKDLIAALSEQLSGISLGDTVAITQNDTIAYFPQAWHWDPKSQLLQSSYHDVPWEEPNLVQELARIPYPDRSPLARIASLLRRKPRQHRSKRGGILEMVSRDRQLAEARGREF